MRARIAGFIESTFRSESYVLTDNLSRRIPEKLLGPSVPTADDAVEILTDIVPSEDSTIDEENAYSSAPLAPVISRK